VTIKTVTMK